MATGRTSGLSTMQGHYWHAILLGNVPLARRLQARAELDKRSLGGVLVGMFIVMVDWLRLDLYSPAEIRRFAERVARLTHATLGVTEGEVSRLIDRELGETADDDVRPVRHGTTELAVVITAAGDLELKPGEIDRLISTAEGIARQWGIDLPVYRPGLIMRCRFEIAEGRWYGYPARRRWSAERMGAFVGWLRDDSTA
ncbi:hypothetical protein [Micromonospora sp. NPDC005197]|uniref:hypothetical protein n=1 Tax=Micromonospora sp. NPDC005197 TaxID=3157020 RepID=UPI0033B970BC